MASSVAKLKMLKNGSYSLTVGGKNHGSFAHASEAIAFLRGKYGSRFKLSARPSSRLNPEGEEVLGVTSRAWGRYTLYEVTKYKNVNGKWAKGGVFAQGGSKNVAVRRGKELAQKMGLRFFDYGLGNKKANPKRKKTVGRKRNIAMGYYDATGFHPIRASADYDESRVGEIRKKRSKPSSKKAKKTAKEQARSIRATKKTASADRAKARLASMVGLAQKKKKTKVLKAAKKR